MTTNSAELKQALRDLLECISETRGKDATEAVANARALLERRTAAQGEQSKPPNELVRMFNAWTPDSKPTSAPSQACSAEQSERDDREFYRAWDSYTQSPQYNMHQKDDFAAFEYAWSAALASALSVPEGFVIVPDAEHMTDDQAEAIAKHANCCGGIAHDIYLAAIEAAPKSDREQG